MIALLALTKISCILLATIGLHITATPPHPPPAKSDQAPSTSWEVIVKYRGGPVMVKFICWLAAFAEISLIVTQVFGYQSLLTSVLDPLGIQLRVKPVEQPFESGSSSLNLYLSPMFLLGACLAAIGGYIRHCCYQALGCMFTFEMAIMKEHKLVTTGPYAWARHPAYTGVLCTVSGIVMLHCASGSSLIEYKVLESALGKGLSIIYLVLTSIITIGLLKRIPKEDEALAKRFGQEWKVWSQRVPFKLFWGIY
ncbi:hypothetical protein J3R30DRAFT_3305861 [Lentinula aciculospora]|uniref:Protein-S-isoprenylcysteine O-methyltransferase n=1 Tax=Lentinula aciculospora TaxID=153920 RepID=A0A9W8ZVM9_9AGAR|nr:hypothetical protein J3R30DRAFT_3305861 [Lentinula aciculospora]